MANNNNNNVQIDAHAFVAAHELRNENQTLGKEENILLGVVDLQFTLGTDQPAQVEVTKISNMFRQKEFSRTGPAIITSTNMTLEKFMNGLSMETKLGRVIQVATARNAINHVIHLAPRFQSQVEESDSF